MTSSLMGANALSDPVPIKQYTADLKGICEHADRVTIMAYRCNIEGLIGRFLYGIEIGTIASTLVLGETDHDGYDLAIVVTDDDWGDLPERLKKVKSGVYYTQLEADWPLLQQSSLKDSDWMILRELERQFLSTSALHTKREAWRSEIDLEIKTGLKADEKRTKPDSLLAEGESASD